MVGYMHHSKTGPLAGLTLPSIMPMERRVFSEEPYDLSLRDDLLNLGHG
jgi:hypothetical protein